MSSFPQCERYSVLLTYFLFFVADTSKWPESWWQVWQVLLISLWFSQALFNVTRVYAFSNVWQWELQWLKFCLKFKTSEMNIKSGKNSSLFYFLLFFLNFIQVFSNLHQPNNSYWYIYQPFPPKCYPLTWKIFYNILPNVNLWHVFRFLQILIPLPFKILVIFHPYKIFSAEPNPVPSNEITRA